MEESKSELSSAMTFVLEIRGFTIAGLFWAILLGADAEPIDRKQVATIFSYPFAKLIIQNITEEGIERYGPNYLAGYEVKSKDNSFAPVIFTIGRKGLILTEEVEGEIASALQKQKKQIGEKPLIQRIALGGDAYGYTGLGGFGPGGSEEIIFATIPARNLDVGVKIVFSRDELTDAPGTEAYHRILEEGREQLAQRLIECVKLTVVAATSLPSLPAQTPQPTPPSVARPPAPPTPTQTATTTPVPSRLPTKPVAQTPALVADRGSPIWPWLIGVLVLIVIVAVALKRGA